MALLKAKRLYSDQANRLMTIQQDSNREKQNIRTKNRGAPVYRLEENGDRGLGMSGQTKRSAMALAGSNRVIRIINIFIET